LRSPIFICLPYFFLSSYTHLFASIFLMCLFTYLYRSSLIPWQAARYHKQEMQCISDQSPRQNLPMAFWSLDCPPTWQAPDSQGCASGRFIQTPHPSVSHIADTKVCLSLCAFALGETLREFESRALQVHRRQPQVHPNKPARNLSVISKYQFMTVYSKPATS